MALPKMAVDQGSAPLAAVWKKTEHGQGAGEFNGNKHDEKENRTLLVFKLRRL
jgi:hypothetical protein